MQLTVDDFDYPLPPELIAQHPVAERTGSRMLYVCGQQLADRQFADLPTLLQTDPVVLQKTERVTTPSVMVTSTCLLLAMWPVLQARSAAR